MDQAVVSVLEALLSLEWRAELTAAGTENLFCPFCGGCPGSAVMNPRTQRPDGHRIGTYIRYCAVVHGGCPAASVFDQVRDLLAVQTP